MTSCLLYCKLSPFWKEVYSKRKEFAPTGSKFFPFRVDPFSEGRQKPFEQLPPLEVSIPLKKFGVTAWLRVQVLLIIWEFDKKAYVEK